MAEPTYVDLYSELAPNPELTPGAGLPEVEDLVAEEAARIKQESREDPGFRELLNMAWERNSLMVADDEHQRLSSIPWDMNFTLTEDLLGELTEGLPDLQKQQLSSIISEQAMSEQAARMIANNYRTKLQQDAELAAAGGTGMLATIAGSMADPASALVAAASGGSGMVVKGGRLVSALAGAAGGAMSNATVEALLATTDPFRGTNDIVMAALFGAALGGPLGALFPSETARIATQAHALADELEVENVQSVLSAGRQPAAARPSTGPLAGSLASIQGAESVIPPFARRDPESIEAAIDQVLEGARPSLERQLEARSAGIGKGRQKDALNTTIRNLTEQLKKLEAITRPSRDVVRGLAQFHQLKRADAEKLARRQLEAEKQAIRGRLEDLEATASRLRTQRQAADDLGKLRAGQRPDRIPDELRDQAAGMVSQARLRSMIRNALDGTGGDLARPNVPEVLRRESVWNRGVDDAEDIFVDEGTAGAAQALPLERSALGEVQDFDDFANQYNLTDVVDNQGNPLDVAFKRARWGLQGMLNKSVNPAVRALGLKLVQEAVGFVDRARTVPLAASELVMRMFSHRIGPMNRDLRNAFKQWADEARLGQIARLKPSVRHSFMTAVGSAVRDQTVFTASPAAVQAGATAARKMFADTLADAKKARLTGFENVPSNSQYLPRIYNSAKLAQFNAVYGADAMDELVAQSMVANHPDLDIDAARAVARAYVTRINRRDAGLDASFNHGISMENVDVLREMLEASGRMNQDEVEAIVGQLQYAVESPSRVANAKGRLDVDENYRMQVLNRETGQVEEVSLANALLEDDVEVLAGRYARTMSGWIVMAEQFGIRNPGDLDKMMESIRKIGRSMGQNDNAMDNDMKRIQTAVDYIIGRPIGGDPSSIFSKVLKIERDFNFTTTMNQVGFAQVAEIGNMLGMAGFRNVMSHVDTIGALVREARTGVFDDQLARDLEEIGGNGGLDRILHSPRTNWDEIDNEFISRSASGFDKALARTDQGLQSLRKVVADISGMAPMTVAMQRISAKAVANKMARWATTGRGLRDADVHELRGMGISEEMWPRVQQALRSHTRFEDSMWGGSYKLTSLDVDAWRAADPESLDVFGAAVYRMARRIIQENDIGSMPRWMHSDLGKVFTQFRTFMINAWEKQTLYGLHHRSFSVYSAVMMSSLFGALSYTAQNALNFAFNDDKLEERLSTEEILKAAVNRSGYLGAIPAISDTIEGRFIDDNPTFAYGRSTGLASDLFMGNPTMNTLNKVGGVMGLTKNLSDDREFSQQDYRNITGLMPIVANAVGFRNIHDIVTQDLPNRF